MKVVLTTSPRAEGDLERGGLPFLGIGYIGSWLEKHGYNVKITDPHNLNWDTEKAFKEILNYKPEAVGIASTTDNRFKAIDLIKKLRENNPDLLIFAGGPHFTMTARDALEKIPELDVIVKREGEIPTKELLDDFQANGNFKDIKGIFYRDRKGGIIENPDQPFVEDINIFSLNWKLFDIEKYNRNIDGTNIRAIGVISSRGCPNKCVYCVNAAFRKGFFRLRSPIKFVDEIEFLKREYGFKGFDLWDDTLTISKNHVELICNEILKRKLDIIWYARARVNTVDKELLSLMKKAGCIRISYGIESGSPRILRAIKKNITIEQAKEAVKLSSEVGMAVVTNFMVNLPYETRGDLKMTANLMKELRQNKNSYPAYGFSIPYPGTEMELIARKEGILSENFSWNSHYRNKKYKIAGTDPSLPLMEWQGAEIEKVKAFMSRELGFRGGILKKGLRKIKKVKSIKELRELAKTAINYIKN